MIKFNEELLGLDYLVYSSHKTATQTVVNTLRSNNFKSLHCHSITNETTQLASGTFKKYLKKYYRVNKKKLNIVTTFREPLERHISSFFQWHGNGVIRKNILHDYTETIISRYSINELQKRFVRELEDQTLTGRVESIKEFCHEMSIGIPDLNYNTDRQYGVVEFDYCRLYIFRFDVLIIQNKLEKWFAEITGKNILQNNANISSDHWYYDIYQEFKATLKIPSSTITDIYEAKADLINMMYPGEYGTMLAGMLDKYAD